MVFKDIAILSLLLHLVHSSSLGYQCVRCLVFMMLLEWSLLYQLLGNEGWSFYCFNLNHYLV